MPGTHACMHVCAAPSKFVNIVTVVGEFCSCVRWGPMVRSYTSAPPSALSQDHSTTLGWVRNLRARAPEGFEGRAEACISDHLVATAHRPHCCFPSIFIDRMGRCIVPCTHGEASLISIVILRMALTGPHACAALRCLAVTAGALSGDQPSPGGLLSGGGVLKSHPYPV